MKEIKELQDIALINLAGRRKSRQISRYFRSIGLIHVNKMTWLAYRSLDIASGFTIEGSLSDIYISTFILPTFDKLDFISWGLGSRLINCLPENDTEDECLKAVEQYKRTLLSVRNADSLISYLDYNRVRGFYAIWARYISYLRILDLEKATEYLTSERRKLLHLSVLQKLEKIEKYARRGDEAAVLRILNEWRRASEKIFGPYVSEFSAFPLSS